MIEPQNGWWMLRLKKLHDTTRQVYVDERVEEKMHAKKRRMPSNLRDMMVVSAIRFPKFNKEFEEREWVCLWCSGIH
jgi:hypothetical protein